MDSLNVLPVNEQTLLDLGIITKEKLYKYPLKATNLQVLLKVYATLTYQPFDYYTKVIGLKGVATEYYTTPEGIQWLYNFFSNKTLKFARVLCSNLFVRAKEETLKHLDTYPYFNNFRGTSGVQAIQGSKTPALIIRTVGKRQYRYEFKSIYEARQMLNYWLLSNPIEQFAIYRIKTKDGYTFKEQIKTLVERKPNKNMGRTEWTKI